MGLFGSKNKLNDREGHNDYLLTDDDDFMFMGDSPLKQGVKQKVVAPHAIVAEEILGTKAGDITDIDMHHEPQSVYEKLKEKEKEHTQPEEDDYVPSWAVNAKSEEQVTYSNVPAEVSPIENLPAEDWEEQAAEPEHRFNGSEANEEADDDFLVRCKEVVDMATTGVHYGEKSFEIFAKEDYYKPLETTADVNQVNVDDIIRRLKGEHNLPEMNSEPENSAVAGKDEKPAVRGAYNTEATNFGAEAILNAYSVSAEPTDKTINVEEVTVEEAPQVPVEEIPMVLHKAGIDAELFSDEDEQVKLYTASKNAAVGEDSDSNNYSDNVINEEPNAVKVKVEVIPTDSDSDIMHTDMAAASKLNEELENTVVFGGMKDIDDLISAISNQAETEFKKAKDDEDDEDGAFNEEYDDDEYDEQPYYELEDKDLAGIDDYKNLNDAVRLRTKLMKDCAAGVLFTALSFAVTALIAVFSALSSVVGTSVVGYVNLMLLIAVICFNYSMFADLKRLYKFNIGFDTCVSLAAVVMLVQNCVSCFAYNGKFSAVTGAVTFLMSVNSLFKLIKSKRVLKGLEIIANSEPKNAVTAAGGAPAAAIASGAVDGECIVLSGREAVNIKNYLKNCGYKSPFDLNCKMLFSVGAVVSLILGLVIGIMHGLGMGITAAALLLCCCYPACAVMSSEMPMWFTTKKLSGYGAMLAGYRGAYKLNMANVIGIKTSDLFPEGSVTLYNMKPLSNNEIGHSLMYAAAVAKAANSPLSPLFESIVGEVPPEEMPKVTGVQYEDKMGISGWIGDLTVLIGNRNLMQGHNVSVPPASVDQKILRKGYFPVYVACDGVPCLLFIIKYEADAEIAKELQRVCDTGMTVVVYPEDANASDAMLCDYFGVTDNAVKVMRHNGRIAYEKATGQTETTSAPASYGKSVCGLFAAVTASIKLKGIMSILTVLYIIAAVLGVVTLTYLTIIGKMALITSPVFIAFQAIFMIISALLARMVNR